LSLENGQNHHYQSLTPSQMDKETSLSNDDTSTLWSCFIVSLVS